MKKIIKLLKEFDKKIDVSEIKTIEDIKEMLNYIPEGQLDLDLGGAFIKEVNGNLVMEPIAYYRQSAEYAVHS
ncbi:MAG: hypothetical protein U9Q83_07275, partial [Bacteroidota bacterium]|nr:hypothetical protein [Bacteroidota bacterium]